ncbi:MAG: DUF4012 domain-containing protein [Candidatus Pacebacteria bacterium]|nr:DUF4012 domain-containing protein [Candidatus Paceibacterota bacterium]
MELSNKKISSPIAIFSGILIFLIIGSFFFIALKSAYLQEANGKIISLLEDGNFDEAMSLIDELALSNSRKNNDLLQKFSFIPFVKEKIQLSQHLVAIKENLEKINNGTLLSAMIQQEEDSLSILNNLKDNLSYFEKYNFPWYKNKNYQLENWLSFFGEKEEKNYLILFQDPDISRPTGGFIGAYALLAFDRGKISLKGDTIFSLEEVFLDKIIPPAPLQGIGDRWLLHDANWFFDCPSSGQKILSFYSKTEKNPVLDGVIFANIKVMETILEIIGPLEIKDHNLLIDQNNFTSFYKGQVQELAKPAPLRQKKNSLPSFFKELQEKIKGCSLETLVSIPKVLVRSFEEKDLQIYLVDDNLEYFFDTFDWTGKIKESKNDYLGVTFNLLRDDFTEDTREKMVELDTEFSADGEIINYLTISAPNFSSKEKLIENYLKIYLPKGIIIKGAKGSFLKSGNNTAKFENFYNKLGYQKDEELLLIEENTIRDGKNNIEIYEEEGKTVIGCWVQLSTRPFSLIYKFPGNWKQFSDWELIVQKQSGQKTKFSFELITPKDTKIVPSLFPFNQFIPLENDLTLTFQKEN